MDVSLRSRAEELASEIASQAKTAEDLNGLMRLMMKSALERMLNSEMDVHLGRRTLASAATLRSRSLSRRHPSRPLHHRRAQPNAHPTVAMGVRRKPSKAIWVN